MGERAKKKKVRKQKFFDAHAFEADSSFGEMEFSLVGAPSPRPDSLIDDWELDSTLYELSIFAGCSLPALTVEAVELDRTENNELSASNVFFF